VVELTPNSLDVLTDDGVESLLKQVKLKDITLINEPKIWID
jgi:hypothetical protein